jgi:hypothetical protein
MVDQTHFISCSGRVVRAGGLWCTLEYLFEQFTKLDGTPCGKEVE